jgi:hypothetical protein
LSARRFRLGCVGILEFFHRTQLDVVGVSDTGALADGPPLQLDDSMMAAMVIKTVDGRYLRATSL